MINFILWKWRQRMFRESYEAHHVNTMVRLLGERVRSPHRVVCVTDRPSGVECPTHPMWDDHRGVPNISGHHLPSCYRRLKIFDPATQAEIGIPVGERIVSVDLDAVPIQDMTSMFDRSERFVGWVIKGHYKKAVINGSMFMLTAGDLGHVWTSFEPTRSPMRACNAGYMGSDQGHMSYTLLKEPYVGGWRPGEVLSFTRDVVRGGVRPSTSKIVFFAGNRKPWHAEVQKSAPWVSSYVKYEERTAA